MFSRNGSVAVAAALLVAVLLLIDGLTPAQAKTKTQPLVDPMRHSVFAVTPRTFDGIIGKFRSDNVAAVLHYSGTAEDQRKYINGFYNVVAEKLRGMVKLAAIDCAKERDFCAKESGDETVPTPAVYIYPPNPMPVFKFQGEKDVNKLSNQLLSLIPNKYVHAIDAKSLNGFLKEHVAVPKVLLFSKKEKSPTIFNALANALHDRLSFGFVRDSEESLVKKYNIKKFPAMILVKGEAQTVDRYSGEMQYMEMFEFLNIRSETFVKGGGFSQAEAPEERAKPWLKESIPELHRDSYPDLCGKGQSICIVYLSDKQLTQAEVEMLEAVREESGEEKGLSSELKPKFDFMWMNLSEEPEFKELFRLEAFPNAIALNMHKRPRYMLATGPTETVTKDSIRGLVVKILEGDARFTYLKAKKLPKFAARATGEADGSASLKKKKDEL